MPVPSAITDLSTTAASNSPASSESVTDGDDHLRAAYAFIAQVRDGSKNLEAGTNSAPSLAFTGDSNTGVYSPGADQFAVTAGGTQRYLINGAAHTITGTLAVSSTLTVTGAATASSEELGYRDLPWTASTGETAATTIRGKGYKTTGNIEVPASVFSGDDVFAIYNNSASSITVTQGSGLTLRWAGTTSTGNRTLAARGMCFVSFISATEAIILGAGVS